MTEQIEVEAREQEDHKGRLNAWFDEKFIPNYSNPDKVESARKLLHRYRPDDKVLDEIYEWVLEDNKRRALARKQNKFYRPACNCYSFFSDQRWRDPHPKSDIPVVKETGNDRCTCGARMIWTNGTLKFCTKCYDNYYHHDFKRKVYDHLCSIGLGKLTTETREQWFQRIKTDFKQTVRGVKAQQRGTMALPKNPSPSSRRAHEAGEGDRNDV